MASQKGKKTAKSEKKQFSFLGLQIPGGDRDLFRRHLLILAGISILTKFIVVFLTTVVFSSFIDLFDISFYLRDANRVFMGQIPYVNFSYYYPQLSLISVLLPYLVALLFHNIQVYVFAHQALMCAFDLGTTLLVYLVALRFSDQKQAFLCGILSATAIAAAYFVLTKYDAFPTFVLVLSLALFLYGKKSLGYAGSAAGFLVKWFPIVAYPYYLVHDHLQGDGVRALAKKALIGIVIVLVFTVPFMILSWEGFLYTYTFNAGGITGSPFNSQAQSLAFYLDFIVNSLSGSFLFGKIVYPLMIIVELLLLGLYWKLGSRDQKVLTSFIFFAVTAFMVLNPVSSPQYIIWVTPFLALLLAGSALHVLLFFAYQVWVYLEFPFMYNVLYTNQDWLVGPMVAGVPAVFLFFTVKFVLLAGILWVVARQVLDRARVGTGKAA